MWSRRIQAIAVVLFVFGLSGCSVSMPRLPFIGGEPRQPTLGDELELIEARTLPTAADAVNPAIVLELYRQAASNEKLRRDVDLARRIAQLSLANAAVGEQADYARAAEDLEHLADLPLESDELAKVRYQLAGAYEGAGRQDAVKAELEAAVLTGASSPFTLEARFRLGEAAFMAGEYADAVTHYRVVAQEPGNYRTHAAYMLGWAQFKQGAFDAALPSLGQALDGLLDGRELDVASRELLTDARRVMLIALEYEGGIDALDTLMTNMGNPAWQAELYRTMSGRYADAQRFADSVAALDAFIQRAPSDRRSPAFHLKTLDLWRDGGFAEQLQPRKDAFIERFDVRSEFFAVHGWDGLQQYAVQLREYLDERCARRHALAQESADPAAYTPAADCHQRWLENFPAAEQAPHVRFLMAEALLASGATEAAVAVFDVVAEGAGDEAKDAAYAVVTLSRELATEAEPRTAARIAAGLRFAGRFANDPRASAVQLDAAGLAFAGEDFELALVLADEAVTRWDLGAEQAIGLRIRAHSAFELQQFANAERDYRLLLELPDDATISRDELTRRALASVLRQGEQARDAGDYSGAIGHLDRLAEIDPDALLTRDAFHDSAALLELAGQPEMAAARLVSFRKRYPRHAAVPAIAGRLVALYEQTGASVQAADELMSMHRTTADVEVKRTALYHAAELYYSAQLWQRAIETFRAFAHGFEQPVALRLEAMHHMDLLYQRTAEPGKRRFWLRKIMATVDAAIAAETEAPATQASVADGRAAGLAAEAALVLAEDALAAFNAVAISAPLERSVPRKQKAMRRVIAAMEKVASYGAQDLSSLPTLHIASAYEAFAEGLLQAEAPGNLNELEREQYLILVEEQAYPFEEEAIEIHAINVERAWATAWDQHTLRSLGRLARLAPGRYAREEEGDSYVDELK